VDTSRRNIEIFAPFSAAIDLTRRILFQPFDLTKWLAIGLAAFLAGFVDATRFTPGFNIPNFSGRAETHNLDLGELLERSNAWAFLPVIIALGCLGVAVIVALMWLGSRARFMLIDCIVHNRGAVEQPWREYRREGNSLFLLALAVSAISLVVAALLAAPLGLRYFADGGFENFGPGALIYAIGLTVAFILAGLSFSILGWLMAPVMYRQRCSAMAALRRVIGLFLDEPAAMILYVLFGGLVAIAGSILALIATCLTCCIAAIPYVGTVLLLPLYVFYYAYLLLFLRQFGPEYDVWATVQTLAEETPAEPPAPPSDETATPPPTEPPPLPT
jgi:hypothetical protein